MRNARRYLHEAWAIIEETMSMSGEIASQVPDTLE